MRTTIDLPDEVFRAAKIRAAETGEPLKELVTRAIQRELSDDRPTVGEPVVLPLVPRRAGAGEITVTGNREIEEILGAEDAERYGGW
jgi:hypothetical protein